MSNYKVNINGIDTNNLKVLKMDEMNQLFERLNNGDISAKEELVNGNLKLVLSLIKNYNNGINDMNDLFQVGCVGLLKAIDNFDTSVGVMFSTYAVPLILGEVKRYLRDSTELKVTRSIRDLAYRIMKYKEKYVSLNGYEPSTKEVLDELDITEYDYCEAMDSFVAPMSIYEPIYNDGGDTIYLLDQIGDFKIDEAKNDDLINIREALNNIKVRERNVLIDRFIVGKTQIELASELGVSQAQISRIEKSAINNIKKLIR